MKRTRETIVSATAEDIDAMIARGEDRTDWARVDAMTDEDRRAARARDPDAVTLPEGWADEAIAGIPEPKEQIALRVDRDVLRWFRSQGKGYQTRMNAVLRAYMQAVRRAEDDRQGPSRSGGHR